MRTITSTWCCVIIWVKVQREDFLLVKRNVLTACAVIITFSVQSLAVNSFIVHHIGNTMSKKQFLQYW